MRDASRTEWLGPALMLAFCLVVAGAGAAYARARGPCAAPPPYCPAWATPPGGFPWAG
jgi:hypothetical protein